MLNQTSSNKVKTLGEVEREKPTLARMYIKTYSIREVVVGLSEDLTTRHENFDSEWLISTDVQEGKSWLMMHVKQHHMEVHLH